MREEFLGGPFLKFCTGNVLKLASPPDFNGIYKYEVPGIVLQTCVCVGIASHPALSGQGLGDYTCHSPGILGWKSEILGLCLAL